MWAFADFPFTEQVKIAYLGLVSSRLSASQSLTKGSDLYAYPAGTSFCSCASSRATLHVGSLFLRNRQPSAASPLLLSPTGRATRRGPLMQNTLGGTPRPHAPERPLGKPKGGFPKRGLNGAYRVSATHFYRLPRWSAEWRTTTPVPSSKEGDYRDSRQILLGLLSSLCEGKGFCFPRHSAAGR